MKAATKTKLARAKVVYADSVRAALTRIKIQADALLVNLPNYTAVRFNKSDFSVPHAYDIEA